MPSQYRDNSKEFLFQTSIQHWKQLGFNTRTQEGRDWFRQKALESGRINRTDLFRQGKNWVVSLDRNSIGRMFLFNYNAKLKRELPYWDAFPLIFPFGIYNDGFIGLNLHYLPPALRAFAMDKLYEIKNNNRYDDRMKLNVSYDWLKSASGNKWYIPCVKRYLNNHVRSVFIYVTPREWDYILMLPLARWQKATAEMVWMDSRAKILKSTLR